MLQGMPINDPVLEKRGIPARMHKASYRFLFFLAFIGKNGHENNQQPRTSLRSVLGIMGDAHFNNRSHLAKYL